jgi:glucosamine-phosphate N-acetyltransferase
MNKVLYRPVLKQDLNKVFSLLQQLTEIDYSKRNIEDCWHSFISNKSSNSLVSIYKDEIIAYGSIVIENKIRGEKAGHIEDIVVNEVYRGKGVGEKLIKELIKIGKDKGCYRITLLCNQSLEKFYMKNGFKAKEIAMKLYT